MDGWKTPPIFRRVCDRWCYIGGLSLYLSHDIRISWTNPKPWIFPWIPRFGSPHDDGWGFDCRTNGLFETLLGSTLDIAKKLTCRVLFLLFFFFFSGGEMLLKPTQTLAGCAIWCFFWLHVFFAHKVSGSLDSILRVFSMHPKSGETAVLIIVLLLALFGTWTVGELFKHVEIGVSACWLQISLNPSLFAKHQVRNSFLGSSTDFSFWISLIFWEDFPPLCVFCPHFLWLKPITRYDIFNP